MAIRLAKELAREDLARKDMHGEDWYLAFLRWNTAARSIQMLLPIYRAKCERRKRLAFRDRHQTLLRRVVSHSNERLQQTYFAALARFVADLHNARRLAILVLQRSTRTWLCRRQLQRLRSKRATQDALITRFLGKRADKCLADTFVTWHKVSQDAVACRYKSAVKIQSLYRRFHARQQFKVRVAHQARVHTFMRQLVLSRSALWLHQTFRALAAGAMAARLVKHASATRVQALVRGHQARGLVVRVRRRHRQCELKVNGALAKRAHLAVEHMLMQWLLFVDVRQREKAGATLTLQRVARGRAARHRVRIMREYRYVYYGSPWTQLEHHGLRLAFIGLWKARMFRLETEDMAARTIQSAARRSRNRRNGKVMMAKLKKKRMVAERFNRTFHGVAQAFLNALKLMRQETRDKLNAAACVLQRSLRGWLARRVVARLAKQHARGQILMAKVVHRRTHELQRTILQLWKVHGNKLEDYMCVGWGGAMSRGESPSLHSHPTDLSRPASKKRCEKNDGQTSAATATGGTSSVEATVASV